MKAWIIGVVVLFGVAGGASAQTALETVQDEQFRARQRIFIMERALETAVAVGVDSLKWQLRAVMPDDTLLLIGAPEARGIRLEGYGILFDVEVPGLRQSVAWSLLTMNQTGRALARDLQQMREFVQSLADPRTKVELDRTLQRIQQLVGPVPPAAPERTVAPGTVSAQSIPPAAPAAPPAAPQIDPNLLFDPDEAYTREVKAALVDAMIENGDSLEVGADEWLAVAARDNAPVDRFLASDPSEVMTIMLRIKGSDLSAYRAGRLTLDEARARVEVSEF